MSRRSLHMLVVGGGLMGLCTARSLLDRGHRVTLFEKDRIPNAFGASVDRHRLIRYTYGARVGYTRMVRDAFQAWERLWSDVGAAFYEPTGTLIIGDMDDPWVRQTEVTLAGEGIEFEWIEHGVSDRYPVLDASLDRALLVPEGGVLLADEIVRALHSRIATLGADIVRRTRVTSIGHHPSTVHLDDGRSVRGDGIIVAAGPWTGRLLPGLAARVIPSRQVCLFLKPSRLEAARWAEMPMLINLDERDGFYAVPPVVDTPLKIGDHRFSLSGDPEAARTAAQHEIDAIAACIQGRFNSPGHYRVSGSMACFYSVADEERFIVEKHHGAWVLAGFSGHGFKFGPLIGERVAEAVDGERRAEDVTSWAAGRG